MTSLIRPDREGNTQRQAVSPARLAAFEILRRVEGGAYASVLLASQEDDLKPADRALCYELVMGVLRRQLWLDRLIENYASRSITSLDLAVRIALRVGLYQLRFLTRVPASAAVNESVNLVRRARLRSAMSFVNAVLRRASREPEYDPATKISDPVERVAVETSHPAWLIERWNKAFGAAETERFATANNQPAPIAFRVVPNRAREAIVLDQLQLAGAILQPSQISNGAWRVFGGGSLLRELSRAGQIYMQDEASQLVAQLLDAKQGERVLDLCSAPGSKATQIAARGSGGVSVIAADLHEHRLKTVVESARLQGVGGILCVVLDGLESLPFPTGSFDRVLVDAPCSGTGTLRHNPEIRWRISPEDIRDLSTRQKQMLSNASQLVKPGGRLVYSSCSVEPEENEEVVSAFLESSDGFVQKSLPVKAPLATTLGAARTWPHRDGVDGFFIAAFERDK
ncbi:MAG: 16S rRNA (cytosine(967)-C(5))-methyltransferase RsmB [Pyrinomonadaceae bacterium]